MKRYSERELKVLNQQLKGHPPAEIVSWVILNSKRPVVTTNFRPYEAAILHACVQIDPSIKVIWCDTGYNTSETYKHAQEVISQLNLTVELYVPKQTTAYREVSFAGIPEIDDPLHAEFTEQVKLEPFLRAMKLENPDVWFTNLRKGQTEHRDHLDILSYSKDNLLKVSPFYYWNDKKLDGYLLENNLPNEFNYYDPTKVLAHRECGLHLS